MHPFPTGMLAQGLSGVAAGKTYAQDVFSTKLYTGDGSSPQVITGLPFTPDLVWQKARNTTENHNLFDALRGGGKLLDVSSTSAEQVLPNQYGLIGQNQFADSNYNQGTTVASWLFKRAPKFFDVVAYTGNAVVGRQIPHALGATPGIVIVKRLDTAADWFVWHKDVAAVSATRVLILNSPGPSSNYPFRFDPAPNSTSFGVMNNSGATELNAAGARYVAYLFAHDTSADGLIQCGSYAGNGTSAGPVVNLGWKPQYLLVKNITTNQRWVIFDSSRGLGGTSQDVLVANESSAENGVAGPGSFVNTSATGFQFVNAANFWNSSGDTFVYMAVRAPTFTGTVKSQDVHATSTYTADGGNKTITNGVDLLGKGGLVWTKDRSSSNGHYLFDSVRGDNLLRTQSTAAESLQSGFGPVYLNNGYTDRLQSPGGTTVVGWSFARASKFFDIVTYTGNGASGRQIPHGLSVAPGMIIVKRRDATESWPVWHRSMSETTPPYRLGKLNTTDMLADFPRISTVSATTITLDDTVYNVSGATYVAYLFAHDPDTNNGLIQCGSFTSGAQGVVAEVNLGWKPQFLLIKSAGSADSWYMFDATRGLSGNAGTPGLQANSSSAEFTPSGFRVSQTGFSNPNTGELAANTQFVYMAIRAPIPVPPVNTTAPVVSGTPTQTSTLTTTNGVWTNTPTSYTYQWQRDGANISGATAATYTLVAADVGANVRCVVTALNEAGAGMPATSNAVGPVAAYVAPKPQDVHATTLYTGNDTGQTIVNGIDLAGRGGRVCIKPRNGGQLDHNLFSTVRGPAKRLSTNLTDNEFNGSTQGLTAFNSNGFTLTGQANGENSNGVSEVAWADAQAPKYLQIRTFTHTSGTADTFDMSVLGVVGEVTIKQTDASGPWVVWHRSLGNGYILQLHLQNAAASSGIISVSGTTVTFDANRPSGTYYLEAWAHDTGADGLVQCGSLTLGSTANATVSLGWRPQYRLIKCSSQASPWYISDSERGWGSGNEKLLSANSPDAETAGGIGEPTSTGFNLSGFGGNTTWIYRAIRAAY